jgi:hypothetical protein
MSCACPTLPSGTPALATSFGSMGTLRPADPDIFVQIGVDDPGVDVKGDWRPPAGTDRREYPCQNRNGAV